MNQHSETSSGCHPDTAPRKKYKWFKRILWTTGITGACLIVLSAIILASVGLILTPKRLTPLVNQISSRYLNAKVSFDTVALSAFKHFPYISIQLYGGQIVSRAWDGLPDSVRTQIPTAADTLLMFDQLSVSLNLPDLMAAKISVRAVNLIKPRIYAFRASSGKANWEIFNPGHPSDSATQTPPIDLNIRKITIENDAQITYDSRPDKIFARVDLNHLVCSSSLSNDFWIDMAAKNTLIVDTLRLCDSLPVKVNGQITFDPKSTIRVNQLTADIGGISVSIDGKFTTSSDSIVSHVELSCQELDLQRLIRIIPHQLFPRLRNFDTDLVFTLKTQINGSYRFDGGSCPAIRAEVKTNDGYLYYKGAKTRIDRFVIDAAMVYNPHSSDSTGCEVRKFVVEGAGISLKAQGSVWNLLRDPNCKWKIKGAVQLDTLTALFPSKHGINVRGNIQLDARADFRKSNLSVANIGKTRFEGQLSLDNLLIDIPRDTLFVWVDGGQIGFGSGRNSPDSLFDQKSETLRFTANTDSINLNVKNKWRVIGTTIGMSAQSTADVLQNDSTKVHPIQGNLSAESLSIISSDSLRMRVREMNSRFRVTPSEKNPAVPYMDFMLDAKGIHVRDGASRFDLRKGYLGLKISLAQNRLDSARRKHLLDSLQRIYPDVTRDSLFARLIKDLTKKRKNDFIDADLDFALRPGIATLLRKWDAKGVIRASSGRVITPYFPLTNTLRNVDVEFSTDQVKLKNTQIHSGNSILEVTGALANIRRALLGHGVIKAKLQIEADTLNFNQLIHAASLGAKYENINPQLDNNLAAMEDNDQLQDKITRQSGINDTLQGNPLVIVPANVDADLALCSHYGIYGNLRLDSLKGQFTARNRCLQIKDLQAVSDAGTVNLTALYATRSKTDISTGFDLEMTKVKVDRLIDLIPSVDTLLPMLRSFQGVVDCKIAATAAIDTLMNIDLASLNAACSLHGENMVLLDGQTFAEIAKMLKFKNKEHNLINRISVNCIVHDRQIEMFPFLIEMDRYKAAVSGVHKLDMSFEYHISVLKSPIPFRLGVNIFGTIDKFKFRLGKAKYKNENIPSYVALIDTTRINLRRTINDIFNKGIQTAALTDMKITPPATDTLSADSTMLPLSASDSLELIKQGIIPDEDGRKTDSIARQNSPTTPDATVEPRPGNPANDSLKQKNTNRKTRHIKQKKVALLNTICLPLNNLNRKIYDLRPHVFLSAK